MSCKLGSFEDGVLHCVENNPKNDNFKFSIRARNDDERLEILKDVDETKEDFEKELAVIIGKCSVMIDYNNFIVTIKKLY